MHFVLICRADAILEVSHISLLSTRIITVDVRVDIANSESRS